MRILNYQRHYKMSYKISQSLIKAFAEDNYCPMKLKKVFIDKTHGLIVSESMQRGLYFETLCLGSGVHGKKVNDLYSGFLKLHTKGNITLLL